MTPRKLTKAQRELFTLPQYIPRNRIRWLVRQLKLAREKGRYFPDAKRVALAGKEGEK